MKIRYNKKPGDEPFWERLTYGKIYEALPLYGTGQYVQVAGKDKDILSYIVEDDRDQFSYWPIEDFDLIEEFREKQIDKILEW
jgi:hypothetical protein